MTANAVLQTGLFVAVLVALVKPLGWYMARVFDGRSVGFNRVLGPVERLIYRLAGVSPEKEMTWRTYAFAMLLFNMLGLMVVYLLQRTQGLLPLNPQDFPSVTPDSAFNTAVSFASNTNWQGYGGETTMSYLTQMLALTVQNFVSAATGMAILAALIRGLRRVPLAAAPKTNGRPGSAATTETAGIGNFWVDLTRSILYILLPLSTVFAVVLVSQGVVQTFDGYREVTLLEPTQTAATPDAPAKPLLTQSLAMGPAASQIAIKQLGTNGGGFFNVNSAHPFENPTPFSNFLQVLAILLIPAAFCFTFGEMIGDRRQGWAVLAAMLLLFIPPMAVCELTEQAGTPELAEAGVDLHASHAQAGGNMEGKETRFGIVNSALWASVTTAASNGSVNSMHDSFTPIGGLVPMFLMQLGEVVFGGVGSGLYGMLIFAILAVFIAGLMVGRTPEYLGKKIEAFEMKMASLVILFPPVVVLVGTAIAVMSAGGTATIFNGGPHGFSEVLYAFSSAGNNNGSAFAGLGANTVFYNLALGVAMLIGRYWLAIPVLAIAGSLAQKKITPPSVGTLPTHTPLFVVLSASEVVIVGALTFIPALALGPIVEQLMMGGG